MQLIFKCSHCDRTIYEKRKYVGFNSITLPWRCPGCGSELIDVKSIKILDPPLKLTNQPQHSITSTNIDNSIEEDNISDSHYGDNVVEPYRTRIYLRFNTSKHQPPSLSRSRMAFNGKWLKLPPTTEKYLFDRIILLARILSVKTDTVLYEAHRIVLDIIRKTHILTKTKLDKIIAVALYLTAHAHGISADKETVMDIVENKKEYKKIHRIIAPRLKFRRSTLITVFVSELASELQMNEKLYAMTLQLALQLSRAILDIRQAAALAAYITYNAHALVNKKKTVSFKQLNITPRMFSRIKKIEIMLV